jgi:hypothetical protein
MTNGKRVLQKRIAYDAARILTELRSDNLAYACRKAAAKHGVTRAQMMPSREEIELALREQQRLVIGEKQHDALRKLRHSALEAMQALHHFHPLLVGPVLRGTADSNSRIELHLFADTPEEVLFTLSDLHIPWQEKQRNMTYSDSSHGLLPCFQFCADMIQFVLVVFPPGNKHRRPLDPLDNRPYEGASLKQLKEILAGDQTTVSDHGLIANEGRKSTKTG